MGCIMGFGKAAGGHTGALPNRVADRRHSNVILSEGESIRDILQEEVSSPMIRGLLLAWVGALLLGAQDPTSSEELPAIRAVQGDLHVWSSARDKLSPVTEPVRVTPLDRIGTRKDRFAMLATQDGSLISLSEVEVGR